jgi:hypothetical protein
MKRNLGNKRLVVAISLLLLMIVFFPVMHAQKTDEPKFWLTIIIEGEGTVIKEPDMEGSYPNNTVVTLTANAAEDWNFSHWSGDLTGNDNPATIIMDENKTITAHFIQFTDVTPPVVQITRPGNAMYFFDRELMAMQSPFVVQMITLGANASDTETDINRVEFYVNDALKGTDTTPPFTHLWSEIISGQYTIKAVAYDNAGNSASTELQVFKWRLHPILLVPLIIPLWLIGFIFTHRGFS